MSQSRAFRNPYEIETPPGADGWQSMYPSYLLFSEETRGRDEHKLWLWDQVHNPSPVYPFDLMMPESWLVSLNQATTRVWQVPTSLGIEQRLVNGYLFVGSNDLHDAEESARREPIFLERARHYFENWDSIYDEWVAKATDCIDRLRAMKFEPLPDAEPDETVYSHRGTTAAFDLLKGYSRLLENMHEMAYYHFEMLGLAYGAYLTFMDFCRQRFPSITDQLAARMVAGIDVILYRPDAELRRLAGLAVGLGVADAFHRGGEPAEIIARLQSSPSGEQWLAELEEIKDPWFYYSTGAGYDHTDRAWIDDMRPPFTALRDYVVRAENGEDLSRPTEKLQAERDEIADGYRQLLSDEDKAHFDGLLGLSRQVFPLVENHNFYVEHWHHSIFWNKVREFGRVLVAAGFLDAEDDVFFLHRYEVYPLLYEAEVRWGLGVPTSGEQTWRKVVARRREIHTSLEAWRPPIALGVPPEEMKDPISLIFWGADNETIDRWLAAESGGDGSDVFHGIPASPGVVEGPARVIGNADELDQIIDGEILVCLTTAPSWSIVFSRIAAAVADGGGIMAHPAIVAREYGLPAVVGTAVATQTIRTGDRVRVDGNTGAVTILERAAAPVEAVA